MDGQVTGLEFVMSENGQKVLVYMEEERANKCRKKGEGERDRERESDHL